MILFALLAGTDAAQAANTCRWTGNATSRNCSVAANWADCGGLAPRNGDRTAIEVTNGMPIVVERSLYWDSGGVFWSGGTNATGVPLP